MIGLSDPIVKAGADTGLPAPACPCRFGGVLSPGVAQSLNPVPPLEARLHPQLPGLETGSR